jgi:hypothetical protein
MSKDHGHHHQKLHGSTKRGLHKDWRAWLVVLLMIGTIIAYLASMDERNSPVKDGPTQTAAPAL